MRRKDLLAAARLDLGDVLRSRWLSFCTAVYAVLGAVFLLAGMRESSLLGFTGMGRVMLAFCHALVLLLPLLALVATAQVVNRAREDGSLELLFCHPISRTGWFVAVTLTRFLALAAPLVVLLAVMGLVARVVFHEAVPWALLGRASLVGATLLWAFVGVGLALSTAVRNTGKAMIGALLAWAAAVALLDFGLASLMLQWRLNPRLVFALAALNPVEAARLALLAFVEPDLGTLGPVGFYLATRLGGAALFAVGVLWPALLGSGCWAFGLSRFRRGDLV